MSRSFPFCAPLGLLVITQWMTSAPAHAADTKTLNKRVNVSLSEMPPGRVHCIATGAEGAELSVTWDPASSTSLVRSGLLRLNGADLPSLSCWADPVLRGVEAETPLGTKVVYDIDLSWVPAPADPKNIKSFQFYRREYAPRNETLVQIVETKNGSSTILVTATATVKPLPSPSEARTQLSVGGGGGVSQRSLNSTVPAVVDDTLQLLADIAVERARKASTNSAANAFSITLCDDLRMPEISLEAAADQLWLPFQPGDRFLPATCESVSGRTFAELQEAAPAISEAFARDILHFAGAVLIHGLETRTVHNPRLYRAVQNHLRPITDDLVGVVAHLATDGRPPGPADSQAVLASLALHDWLRSEESGAPAVDVTAAECALDLSFAVVATCQADRTCNAPTLSDMLQHPENWFTVDGAADTGGWSRCEEAGVSAVVNNWHDLPELVAQGLLIASPPAGTSDRAVTRSAIDLGFALTHHMLAWELGQETTPGGEAEDEWVLDNFARVWRLALALQDGDSRTAAVEGFALLREALDYALQQSLPPSEAVPNELHRAAQLGQRALDAQNALPQSVEASEQISMIEEVEKATKALEQMAGITDETWGTKDGKTSAKTSVGSLNTRLGVLAGFQRQQASGWTLTKPGGRFHESVKVVYEAYHRNDMDAGNSSFLILTKSVVAWQSTRKSGTSSSCSASASAPAFECRAGAPRTRSDCVSTGGGRSAWRVSQTAGGRASSSPGMCPLWT